MFVYDILISNIMIKIYNEIFLLGLLTLVLNVQLHEFFITFNMLLCICISITSVLPMVQVISIHMIQEKDVPVSFLPSM